MSVRLRKLLLQNIMPKMSDVSEKNNDSTQNQTRNHIMEVSKDRNALRDLKKWI